jgi:ATP-dependent DNA helicase RecQ
VNGLTELDLLAEVNAVATYLQGWPTAQEPVCRAAHLNRLIECLRRARSKEAKTGWADLAVLIRQLLRVGTRPACTLRADFMVLVPSAGIDSSDVPWPTIDQWSLVGVRADLIGETQFRLTASPWMPDWMPDRQDVNAVDTRVSTAPFPIGFVRKTVEVPADPFLHKTFPNAEFNLSTYTSAAHKQAVRSVMSCNAGSTLIINLPTGAGKSTVALAPVFSGDGVSVMVVPTVALAMDQERRVRDDLKVDLDLNYAYTGETDDHSRLEMRRSIRSGAQRLIFVSPEALTRSLVPALLDAASNGFLRYFIVDEAHLVDQWGSEFRPQFQAMAGLRNELLRVQTEAGFPGFRTVLMTATMPAPTADLLLTLFGSSQSGGSIEAEALVANELRPEPEYWFSRAQSEDEKRSRVLEALRHLPRPAIVYVTTPPEAESLLPIVREVGFERVRTFTGKTRDGDRRKVLEGFRGGAIDLVIATSAFGLGVDQNDVRTVIHATVPERIDRYYQEVGRAGRDGRASVAFLCWTDRDSKVAARMAQDHFLQTEVGLARWRALMLGSEYLEGRGYLLKSRTLRPGLEYDSDENEKWNIRLLGLLSRSGLVKPSWHQTPLVRDEDEEVDDLKVEAQSFGGIVVKTEGAVDEKAWIDVVEPARKRAADANRRAHELMVKVLKDGTATCSSIAEAYDLTNANRLAIPRLNQTVAKNCGGCPAHPNGASDGFTPPVQPMRSYRVTGVPPAVLRRMPAIASYVPPETKAESTAFVEDLDEVLRALVGHRVRMLVAPLELLSNKSLKETVEGLHMVNPDRYFFVESFLGFRQFDSDLSRMPRVPYVLVTGASSVPPPDWLIEDPDDLCSLLILPSDTPDSRRSDGRLLRDSEMTMKPLAALRKELES